jgi:galactonate dehydratase
MKIVGFETLMANAGLRNYLFIRLTAQNGMHGIGEASLEWQEDTVRTFCHEWVEHRVLGRNTFDTERVIGDMIRDQYQGGATAMTAISGVEIAMWDLIGKICDQPVYRLLGGRAHRHIPAYANGWYGGCSSPESFAERAAGVAAKGYRALKLDPFGTAWKHLSRDDADAATEIVRAVRDAVGPRIGIAIEFHGRLAVPDAITMARRLQPFDPLWCEEPVTPDSLDLLMEVKRQVQVPLSAGERFYTLPDFYRLTAMRAADIVQMDIAHCGGILTAKKIAAMVAAQDLSFAPHCSIGPVALAATLHLDWSSPGFLIQEAFGEFDVPWRNDLVRGWNPLANGEFTLPEAPGLGLELDDDAIADHPYQAKVFPSLWDIEWSTNFTQNEKSDPTKV